MFQRQIGGFFLKKRRETCLFLGVVATLNGILAKIVERMVIIGYKVD